MSKITNVCGNDTLKLNDRIFSDFVDGETIKLDPINDRVTMKTGKNGNSIIAVNNSGRQRGLTIRLLRGSPDDKFLNALKNSFFNDPTAFTLLTGEYTKNIADGNGGITQETNLLSGGVFKKDVGGHENADGDSEQGVVVWELLFADAVRAV
jgi:hypothetical protein